MARQEINKLKKENLDYSEQLDALENIEIMDGNWRRKAKSNSGVTLHFMKHNVDFKLVSELRRSNKRLR